jgi:hypothetical protein
MIKLYIYFLSLLILLLFHSVNAQSDNSKLNGLGIEIGGGHNTLFWSSPCILTPGGVPVDRTELYLTPNIRLNYMLKLFETSHVLTFIGYNRFGGSSSDDKYYFDVIELGSFFVYNISNLGFGVGGKINSHLNVEYKSSSMKEDRSNWFNTFSGDLGLRASYSLKPIYISIESWFGLTNLANGILPGGEVRQNHYRILLGYTIFSN